MIRDRHKVPRSRRVRSLAALALAAVAACSTPSHTYQDEAMDFAAIKSVGVMPLANLSRDQAAGERVRDVLSTALLATGSVYVLPPGEVTRAISRSAIATPATPSVDDVVKLGQALKAEALLVGTLREYGEVRSGSTTSNVISLTIQLVETASGKVVWSGSTTKGGISVVDRLLGGGGDPMNEVTEEAVNELVRKMLE